MRKKLLCLDSNSILNRAFYGIRLLSSKDGVYTNAVFGFLNILQKMLADFSPDYICCAFDLKGPTFRHAMYDGYKAQRKSMPEELAVQLPIIKELLTLLGYSICEMEGFEADDVIGTLSLMAQEQDIDCIIATGDRDSLQLISEHVNICLAVPKNGTTQTTLCDEAYVLAEYGVTPKQLIDIKAIMGDASDNIPGVAGIGKKGASDLIAKYHDIDSIYENLDMLEISPAMKNKLIAGKEMAFLSRTLGTIERHVPLDTNVAQLAPAPVQHAQAYALLSKLEMFSMMDKFGVKNEAPAAAPDAAKADMPPLAAHLHAPISELQALLDEAAPTDILPLFDGDTLIALALIYKEAAYLYSEENCPLLKEALHAVMNSGAEKRVCHVKKLHRLALAQNQTLQSITFDIELAAYLLSPTSSRYQISALAAEYDVQPKQLEVQASDFFPEAFLQEIAVFSGLCDVLQTKIDENEQHDLLLSIELPLAEVLASMERIGFEIDANELTAFGNQLDKDIIGLVAQIYELAGGQFNINSPKQLGTVLFDRLGLPPGRKTKSGYSTDAETLERLRTKHPIVENILQYRILSKLKSTYVDGLLAVIAPDGRIHTSFNQTETRTGRISSTEPNMQNIPVRTELGSQMRRFFRAGEGFTLIDADYSQIELRVLAHIAKDEGMLTAFREHMDIHTSTAARVFNLPPEFVTPLMRSHAKAVNFGIVYGIGAYSLSQDIGVSVAEADAYIKEYLDQFSGVRQYMQDIVAFAKEHGYVQTLFGRRRQIPDINASNKNIAAGAQRIALNTPVQGSAADIIKIAMVRVYRRFKALGLKSRLILQVHDELIAEAALDEQKQVAQILKEEMESAAELLAPLEADTQSGKTWYDAKQG